MTGQPQAEVLQPEYLLQCELGEARREVGSDPEGHPLPPPLPVSRLAPLLPDGCRVRSYFVLMLLHPL